MALDFVLPEINRFADRKQKERLRFLAKGIPGFGHIEDDAGVVEVKRRLAVVFPDQEVLAAVLKQLITVAKFDASYVSKLDPFSMGYVGNVPDVLYHKVLVEIDRSFSEDDSKAFLDQFSHATIGTVWSNVHSTLELFERLMQQRVLNSNDPQTLTNILKPLQQCGRPDLAEYVRQSIEG